MTNKVIKPAFENVTLTGDLDAKILAGGPMIAYSTPREVGIWVSTAKEARVRIAYYDEDAVEKVRVTAEIETSREDAFTILFRCDRVEPGRKYLYKLYINGKTHKLPFERSFSTPPINDEITSGPSSASIGSERMALLGAHAVDDVLYPPHTPIQKSDVIERLIGQLQALDPTAMLWVGNSILMRTADTSSKTGYDLRYGFARNWKELRSLQATVPQYAAPGADDLGASASNGWLELPEIARLSFNRFWPVPHRNSSQDLSYSFTRSDVKVFVLDAFAYRNKKQRYGQNQIDWLMQGLEANQNKRLRVVALGEAFASSAYKAESKALLKRLRDAAKQGPILLTAPGATATFWVEHAPGLAQLVLGPFTRKPAQVGATNFKGKQIAEGNVYGMLSWSKEQAPTLHIYSPAGDTLMTHSFQ
ncbi:MAG: hypothetical protein AAGJ37_05015 [Pseudomonadota bacterium]